MQAHGSLWHAKSAIWGHCHLVFACCVCKVITSLGKLMTAACWVAAMLMIRLSTEEDRCKTRGIPCHENLIDKAGKEQKVRPTQQGFVTDIGVQLAVVQAYGQQPMHLSLVSQRISARCGVLRLSPAS
jgi:hypothetical protein